MATLHHTRLPSTESRFLPRPCRLLHRPRLCHWPTQPPRPRSHSSSQGQPRGTTVAVLVQELRHPIPPSPPRPFLLLRLPLPSLLPPHLLPPIPCLSLVLVTTLHSHSILDTIPIRPHRPHRHLLSTSPTHTNIHISRNNSVHRSTCSNRTFNTCSTRRWSPRSQTITSVRSAKGDSHGRSTCGRTS